MTTEYGDSLIAHKGEILRTVVGSGLHGTALEGVDDHDEMGIFIQPPDQVIGLATMDQYTFRTQDEGVRSGPGDTDLVIYSLRKWTRLAAQGNPTVLLPLFAQGDKVLVCNEFGQELRGDAGMFVSRQAGERFLGYLTAQKEKMLGLRGNRTNRPELVEQHGFDTKFAMHAIRLGAQGVEFLTTGRITLPVPQPLRHHLLEMRKGNRSRLWALSEVESYERQLRKAIADFDGPDRPDYDQINAMLVWMHERAWGL